MKRLGSFRVWLVALVVVAGLVAVATPHGATRASRIAHLESLVRCPSCQDLSVSQSNSTSALAVRREIVAMVTRGRSDTQILTTIENSFGPTILLSPSTTGLGVVLWALPVALFVGLAITVVVLRRRL